MGCEPSTTNRRVDRDILVTMKRIVSFDLDGTLVNGRYGDLVWNHGIPTEYARQFEVSFEAARAYIRGEYEAVGDAALLWYEIDHWLERFGLSVSADDLLTRYEGEIELLPHVEEVLEYLSSTYTLVVASNAARVFVDKELSHTGMGRYFKHTISATTDYKTVKKEGSFFDKLCAFLNVSPLEVVHVGDHPVFDHDVPSSLGIESYFLLPGDTGGSYPALLPGRRTIRDLKELTRLL